jgi:hypothetical protein
MSSFAKVLLEEGVELELPIDLAELISLLDRVVPGFTCEKYGYQLATVTRAQLGTRWHVLVKLASRTTGARERMLDAPVGCIEMDKLENGKVRFRIPPRTEQIYPGIKELDPEGRFYSALIFHLLNTFQDNKLIELPGVLPTT